MADFDESLPSHSAFLEPLSNSYEAELEEDYYMEKSEVKKVVVPPAPIRQALHTTNGDVQGGTTGRGTNSSNRASCGNSISGDEDSDAGHDRRSNYRNSYNSMSNKLHTTSDFVASSNNSTIYRTSTNSNSLAQTSSYISTAAKNGFTTVNDDYSSTLGNTLSSTKKASAEKPARNGPFKFLKKNSRKEPSAANRSLAKKPASMDTGDEKQHVSGSNSNLAVSRNIKPAPMLNSDKFIDDLNSGTTFSSTGFNQLTTGRAANAGINSDGRQERQVTAMDRPSNLGISYAKGDFVDDRNSSTNSCNDDDSSEILLNGSDYWGLDTTTIAKDNSSRTDRNLKISDHRSNIDDVSASALNHSTISLAMNDWKKQKNAAIDDLAEFENLEKQLEDMDTSDTFVKDQGIRASRNTDSSIGRKSNEGRLLGSSDQRCGATTSFEERDSQSSEINFVKDIDGSNFSTTLKMSATRPRGTLDISENNMMRDSSIDNRQDFNATNHSEDSNLDDDFYLDTRKVSIGDVHNDDDNSWGAVSQPILSMEQPSPVTRASHGGSYTTNFEETKNRQSITRLSNSTMKRLSSRLAASKGKASGAEDSQTPGDRYNAYGPTENFEDANEDDFLKGDVRDSFSVGSLVDNFIGVRKTSSHADSNKTASASSSSKDKIIASRPKSSLQSASNRSRSPHPVAKSKSDSAKEIVESDLIRKGKELESELETYRTENAALKKARKQHEQTLAEVIRQKEEFARWVAEEKQKTLLWCEEQKQLAIKERRAAAKAASESRLKAGTPAMPIRKEKAEIEGLKATIEKMKLDNEKAVKKFKANENRLYSNIKEHAQKLDELRLQNISLEEEKLALFEIIDAAGLRIPKHLKASIQKLLSREALLGKSNRKYHNSLNNSTNYGVPDSYGEEVDVECLQVSSSYHVDQDSYQDADCGYNMVQKTEKEEEEGLDYRINDLSLNNEIVNRTEEIGKVGVNSSLNASNSWARSSTRSNRYGTAGEELSSYEHSSVHEVKIHGSIDNGRSSLDKRLGNTASQNDSGQISSFMKTSSDVLHRKPNTETAIPSLSKTSYLAGTIAENQEVNNFGVKPDSSGRTEKFLSDGRRVIHYRNGTVKEVSPDGSYIVKFVNGDTKQANPKEGTITYFYAEANTKHITYTTDGLEIYEFPNEQIERHYANGVKEIVFPDKTRKVISTNGLQESYFPDGVLLREYPNGEKEIISPEERNNVQKHL